MTTITSVQNPRVKDAVRLRDRRHREKQGRIVIDGIRELGRAVAAGIRLVELYVCEALCQGEETQRFLATLERKGDRSMFSDDVAQADQRRRAEEWTSPQPSPGFEVLQVTEAVMEKLAFGQRAEGVLGVAEMPRPRLDDLVLPENPLVAVLEGVEKPGNLGAVLRSADGAGLSAVVAADTRTDLYNPNAIRASLGTIFTMPVCEASGAEVLDWLRRRGVQILAARVDGSVPYTEIDYRRPSALVLGSEAEGLTGLWSATDCRAIRLPMLGAADSLNVSATAAVLFYEARRQRGG
jgi:RNA methyltransferase, TrmH family